MGQRKNIIDQKKLQLQLSHKQTSTINAVLATGEFISSSTRLLIHSHDDSRNSDDKTGTAAMSQLLKLSQITGLNRKTLTIIFLTI